MAREVTLERLMRQAELHTLRGRRPQQAGEWLRVFRWITSRLHAETETGLRRMVDVIGGQYPHTLTGYDVDKMVRKEWLRRTRVRRVNGSYYRVGVAWVTGTGGPCATAEQHTP